MAFCGQLRTGWGFCEPADPQAKGAVERLQGYAETNFEPGRVFANEVDFQDQLDAWFHKASARTHKTLRARPIDRLREELGHGGLARVSTVIGFSPGAAIGSPSGGHEFSPLVAIGTPQAIGLARSLRP